MNLSIKKIADITGGVLIKNGSMHETSGISTDTRTLRPGEAFFALTGENFDGNDYLEAAAAAGAAVIIGERKLKRKKLLDSAYVQVDNSLEALQALAAYNRARFPGRVVAITGSVGKTTTKDILAHILSGYYGSAHTAKTWHNYNNEVGVAKTLLEINEDQSVAVVEMAMRSRGEIGKLAHMVQPDYGIITNVEPVHLETLGTIENIAAAKCEMLPYIAANGKAVINGDQPWLEAAADEYDVEIVTFGYDRDCDCRIMEALAEGDVLKLELMWEDETYAVAFPLPVEALAYNVAAAFAVAMLMGVPVEVIKQQLQSFVSDPQRLQMISLNGGGLAINDTYNANPASMQAALQLLAHVTRGRRSVAVLGDMLELGEYDRIGHQLVGNAVENLAIDYLLTVGPKSREIARAAIASGMSAEQVFSVADLASAEPVLARLADNSSVVLFKSSRALTMEKLLEKWLTGLKAGSAGKQEDN